MRLIKNPKHEDCIDALDTMYPSKIVCVERNGDYGADSTTTVYGICVSGDVTVIPTDDSLPEFDLSKGSVFTLTGEFNLSGMDRFKLFLISRLGYRGMLGLSMVESRGRLTYIDGCSDSLIFGPHRMGDPCLNSLFFPKKVNQSFHTHPDIRLGMVLEGEGVACLEEGEELPLVAGSMFILEEGEIHRFRTEDSPMKIVAYHPTSDTGPTDESHPMKTRTHIYAKT
jgi:mannose-6-phosphate isomerase-like protein (cupin superfamily)